MSPRISTPTSRVDGCTRRQVLGLSVPVMLIMSGCGGRADRPIEPAGPLPPDQAVFTVMPWPGFSAPVYAALAAPVLAVRGDGRVVWRDPERTIGAVPSRYLTAQVDPMAVARFAARAESTGLISDLTDFGSPQVTDLGATTVSLHGEHGEAAVEPYAFSEQFDRDLRRGERRNRERLRELIDTAYSLKAETDPVTYVPDRVVVLEQAALSSSARDTATWPGPDPETFLHRGVPSGRGALRCGELTGAVANTVYLAAQDNPTQRWLVGGTTMVLAVNALPIGLDC